MARSRAQYENEIRTIVVGRVSTYLRKAKIVSRIIDAAESDDFIAFGDFIDPEKSKSFSPSRDDQWLLDKDSVLVDVAMKDGFPSVVTIVVKISLGVNEKYYYFNPKVKKKTWWPSGWETSRGAGIKNWIKQKIRNGQDFWYDNPKDREKYDVNNPNDGNINRISYVISRSIKEKGLGVRPKVFNPYDNADKILAKALLSAEDRIVELYKVAIEEAVGLAFEDFI